MYNRARLALACAVAIGVACAMPAPVRVDLLAGRTSPAQAQATGAVAGQVLDRDNRPVAGATVEAVAWRGADSLPAFLSLARTTTDRAGEFRMADLPAGLCYVRASGPAGDPGTLTSPPTYFPGVAFVEQATPVAVTAGTEPGRRLVFKIHPLRPARVSGRLTTEDGRRLLSAAVSMRPVRDDAGTSVLQDVEILPDGAFTFQNIPPGEYLIRARGDVDTRSPELFGTFRVRVEGRDVDRIDVALMPGARIDGRILIQPTDRARPREALRGMRVRAPLADDSMFGDALTGDVQPDGTYAIRGVASGTHAIGVEGLQDPWVVKSITWRGQDIMDTGIEADGRQTYSDVRITITDKASEVSGVVHDGAGAAAAGATVIFIPVGAQFWTRTSPRLRLLRSDAMGRYTVRGLPAGEYKAVAVRELEGRDPYRHDLLETLSAAGVPVTVRDVTPARVDLALIAPARPSLPH